MLNGEAHEALTVVVVIIGQQIAEVWIIDFVAVFLERNDAPINLTSFFVE